MKNVAVVCSCLLLCFWANVEAARPVLSAPVLALLDNMAKRAIKPRDLRYEVICIQYGELQ